MTDRNSPGASQLILCGFLCVVGTLGLVLFVLAIESGHPWASGILSALLQHAGLSILALIILCALVCLIPFRKGKK